MLTIIIGLIMALSIGFLAKEMNKEGAFDEIKKYFRSKK